MGDVIISLLSGLFGAVLVAIWGHCVSRFERKHRVRGHWSTIHAEVKECGHIAATFLTEPVAAPLSRLPILIYRSSLPALLAERAITEAEAAALVKFYAMVETLNRGLDLVDDARREGRRERILEEDNRNRLKAPRIASPSGALYSSLDRVCSDRTS